MEKENPTDFIITLNIRKMEQKWKLAWKAIKRFR